MKSDSRVSIRHAGQGMPAPLSQRVVMPDFAVKYTDRREDMTVLIARRSRQKPRRRVGRGHEPKNEFCGSRAAPFFKTVSPPPRRDSPDKREPPRGRPSSISGEIGLDPADPARPPLVGHSSVAATLSPQMHV